MEEEIQLILGDAEEKNNKAIEHLTRELLNIRAGKATPSMLNSVMVDYYGTETPLSQVSNVNTPDGKTISIQPWEKGMLQPIEKAIINSNLGFTPMNNGELIIISLPPLTNERRLELVKQVKKIGEDVKVGIRNVRQDTNKEIKKMDISEDMKSNSEDDIQQLTDSFIQKVIDILAAKEKEIMTV